MAINVPLEIRVSGYNGEDFWYEGCFISAKASAGIMNEQGQMLVKIGSDGYTIFTGFDNDNKGNNYYLAKRKNPKKGRLYFVTDYDEEEDKFKEHLKSIENYVLFTNEDTYVFWKPIVFPTEKTVFEIQHMRTWAFNNWKHFYEVKKMKSKGGNNNGRKI